MTDARRGGGGVIEYNRKIAPQTKRSPKTTPFGIVNAQKGTKNASKRLKKVHEKRHY